MGPGESDPWRVVGDDSLARFFSESLATGERDREIIATRIRTGLDDGGVGGIERLRGRQRVDGAAAPVGPGRPPSLENAKSGEVAPQAKSYAEYAQQQQKLSGDPEKGDYAKATKKKR